jgi:hypothetical protein
MAKCVDSLEISFETANVWNCRKLVLEQQHFVIAANRAFKFATTPTT